MSVTHPEYDCLYCDTQTTNPVGAYCSEECKYRDKGSTALSEIERDHRYCSSCYRIRKSIFRPSEHPRFRKKAKLIRESFVGYEYPTENVERGDFGLECMCGNISHSHPDEILRSQEPYSWYLFLLFDHLQEKGAIEQSFDLIRFLEVYWDRGDFEIAIGRALYE